MSRLPHEEAARLLDEAARAAQARARSFAATGLDRSLKEVTQEASTYDNHPSDLGNTTFEREKDTGLLSEARHQVAEIMAAQERLGAGTYGTCERCGRVIPAQRLRILPWTRTCRTCEAARPSGAAVRRKISAQDTGIPLPYGARPDLPQDTPGVDGKEVLEDALRHGSSNSLQDAPPDGPPRFEEETHEPRSDQGVASGTTAAWQGRPVRPDHSRRAARRRG